MFDRRPSGLGPFRAVIRIFPRNTLAPAPHSIGLDACQKDTAAINPAKARLKKMYERHVKFSQSYGFDFHNEGMFAANTASLRPTLPKENGRSPVRRTHSQARSALRKMPTRIYPDCFPAGPAPELA